MVRDDITIHCQAVCHRPPPTGCPPPTVHCPSCMTAHYTRYTALSSGVNSALASAASKHGTKKVVITGHR